MIGQSVKRAKSYFNEIMNNSIVVQELTPYGSSNVHSSKYIYIMYILDSDLGLVNSLYFQYNNRLNLCVHLGNSKWFEYFFFKALCYTKSD